MDFVRGGICRSGFRRAEFLNRFLKRSGGVAKALSLAALTLAGLSSAPAFAEGSRSLYPSTYPGTGSRADLDLTLDATPATAPYVGVTNRRQFIYVYAKAGEYILLGSSNRANGGDVLVFNPQSFGTKGAETIPGTADFTCSATTPPTGSFSGGTLGTIADRAHELGGPNSADNSATVTNGYGPCAYLAPTSGIYGVRFTVATTGGGGATGSIPNLHIGSATVAAWEVQVRGSATSTTDINARAFTYAFVAFTGGNNLPLFHTLYYSTLDGQRYQQTMQGFDPNGYALWGSASGFLDNGQPLYKDIRGGGAQISPGQGQFIAELSAQRPQDPIFVSNIDPAGANAAEVQTVLQAIGVPLAPPPPEIDSPTFNGLQSGNATYVGGGGTFTFSAKNDTSYQIVISAGVDFDPGNPANATLTGLAPNGPVSVFWNGKANDGTTLFPTGTFTFQIVGRNGEIHFPIIDDEGNKNGGPTLTKLNGTVGDTTVFYDDRGYVTANGTAIGTKNGLLCPANPPIPPTPDHSLIGQNSSAQTFSGPNCNAGAGTCFYRYWPDNGNANSDCSATGATGFGDAKALDLWAYEQTPTQSSTLIINPAPTVATVATSVTVPATTYPNTTVNGSFTFSNVSTVDATNVTYAATIGTPGNCPTALSFAPGITFTYNAATCVVTLTGLPTTLTAGTLLNFNFSYTAPASGSVPVNTTITASNAPTANASGVTQIIVSDVSTKITVPATAAAGSTVSGTIDFANSATATATANGITYATTIGTPGSCPSGVTFPTLPSGVTASYNTSTCQVTFAGAGLPASLAPGDHIDFGFQYTGPASGTVPVSSAITTTTPETTTANNTSNGSTTFTVPNITLAKSGPATATQGVAFNDTISLGNSGTVTSNTTVTVQDVLPAGVVANSVAAGTNVTAVNCGTLPSSAGATLTCTVTLTTGLSPGAANGAAKFTLNLTASGTGTVTNFASVDPTGGNTPPTPGSGCAPAASCGSAPTTIAAPANITLAKSGPATATTNGALAYTIALGNSGQTASGATLTVADTLPAGVTFVSAAAGAGVTSVNCTGTTSLVCSITLSAPIAAGAANGAATIVINTTAPSTTGTITNYASVDPTGGPTPPTPGPACAPATSCGNAPTTVNAPPNITLTKSGPATVTAGGALAYTIALGNSGGSASGTTLTVSDVLPTGVTFVNATIGTDVASVTCTGTTTLTCTVNLTAALAAGAANGTATFTINTTAPATAGSITNYASVAPNGGPTPPTPGPTCTPAASCGSAPTTVTTPSNITLAKTGPATATTNGNVTYTIALGNSGTTTSGTTLHVADVLPTGMTFQSAAAGADVASVTCTGTTTLACTVTLTAGIPGLSANGFASFTIVAKAPATSGSVTNYASVDPTGGPTPPTPGPACTPVASCGKATTTINTPANLTLTKTGPATAQTNGTFSYTIALGNSGQTASGTTATVSDVLPAGVTYQSAAAGAGVSAVTCTGTTTLSCTLTLNPVIAAGAANGAAQFTITVKAPSTSGAITNYASVDPTGGPTPPAPGPACTPTASCGSAPTTINTPANLTLTKTGPATAQTNGTFSYTIGLGNSGQTASGTTATVSDVLPTGVTYQSAAAGAGVSAVTCTGTTTLSCAVTLNPVLAAGAPNGAAQFTITVKAPSTSGAITNYASVDPTGGPTPPTPGPACTPTASCGSAPTTINTAPNITLAKSGPATAQVNGNITYTIALGNSGQTASGTSLTVADVLPAGETYQSAAAGAGVTTVNCTGTTTLSCALTLSAPIAAGAANGAAQFTILVKAPGTSGSVTNYASVDPTGGTTPPAPGPACTPTTSCGNAPTTINTPVNITLAKSGPATATTNGSLVYTIALGNSGQTASGTTLTVADVLPTGVTYQSAAAGTNVASVTCTGTTTLSCTVNLTAALAAGAANGAATFTITTKAPSTGGSITNYASVDPTGGTTPPAPGPACTPATSCGNAPTTINTPANITLAKSGPATATTNGSLVYTIALGNSGQTASGTTLTVADVLPTGVTYQSAAAGTNVASVTCTGTTTLSCTVNLTAALAAGAANGAATFTITTKAPATAGSITNYASVDPTGGTTPPAPGPACTPATSCGNAPTTINTPVNVTLAKSGPATATINGSLVYTIALGNSGQTASGTTLTVADVLPAGVTYQSAAAGTNVASVTCTGTTTLSCTVNLTAALAAGAANGAATFTITTKAPATAGSITNYASVDPTGGTTPPAPGPACTPAASCGSAPTTINTPVNITLAKSGPATVTTNGSLVYTIALGNSGQTASGTTLTVADVLPTGVTYQSVAAGTNVTSVTCSGTTTLSCTVNLTAALAAGAANGAASFTITTKAPSTAGSITNYASVDPTGGTTPPTPGPACTPAASCGSAPTTINTPVNITLAKAGPATATVNGSLVYTISLGNSGQSASGTTLTVADVLPAGVTYQSVAAGTNVASVTCSGTTTLSCTVNLTAALAAGAANGAATFTITTKAPATAGSITNYASVDPTGGTTPPTPGPACTPAASCGSAPTTINTPINITLTKSGPATATVNGSLVYTLSLGNSGQTASGTTLTVADVLPNGVTYQSAAPGTGVTAVTCTGTTTLSCSLTLSTALAAGAANGTAQFTITTKAPATAGSITNYASVDPTGGTTPPAPGPACTPAASCGSAPTTINTPINITLTKAGPATAAVNGAITYTISLGNSGQTASGTTLTVADVLPTGETYQSAVAGTGVTAVTCTGTSTLSCTLTLSTALAAGAANGTAQFTINVTAPSTTGSIVNYASVDPTGGTTPPAPGPACTPAASCGSAPTTINPAGAPLLTILKTGPARATAGGTIVYTIKVTNTGSADATNAILTDPPPAGLTYVSAGAPCTTGFACNLGTIAVGQSVTVPQVTFSIGAGVTGTIVNVASVTSDQTTQTSSSSSAILTPAGATVAPTPIDARWMLLTMIGLLAGFGLLRTRRMR